MIYLISSFLLPLSRGKSTILRLVSPLEESASLCIPSVENGNFFAELHATKQDIGCEIHAEVVHYVHHIGSLHFFLPFSPLNEADFLSFV